MGDRVHRATVVMLMIVTSVAGFSAAGTFEWTFEPREPLVVTGPSGPESMPIELVLDDGSSEGDFGVGSPNAQQFLWFNRFTPGSGLVTLDQIRVLFPPGPNMAAGEPIDIVVYEDSDDDPANGAELLATIPATIEAVDGVTFSIYDVDPPIVFRDSRNVLIGVIGRFVATGVTTTTRPAALDRTVSQGRSWLAVWNGDPPSSPTLPPDNLITTIDTFIPGNWMIRAYGQQATAVPTLSHLGMVVLIALLVLSGVAILTRIRT